MRNGNSIRMAHTVAQDARQAVREFHAAVAQPDPALVIFFCSSDYDLDAVADGMNSAFNGAKVVGCTTAGEFGPAGYRSGSLCGASFSAADFTAISGRVENVQEFQIADGQALVQTLLQQLEHAAPEVGPNNTFALQMIDGLCAREEPVTRSFQSSLGEIQMVGGSAGDGLKFGATRVFADGAFHSGGALLVLVNTGLPFTPFKTQHFVPTDMRTVVTLADAPHRVVNEIDGLPAAHRYAELIGVSPCNLDPMRFANAPVVVMIDGTNYVRSIQKVNPDGSLTFYCAIEEGLTLRLANGVDLVRNLEQALDAVSAQIGEPLLVLGFDCILRKLEISRRNLERPVSELLRRHHVIGFNTYGEQFAGVHVNQTLTGIAIGNAP